MRPYQEVAVGRLLLELEARRSTLLVMPTGSGKTRVCLEVAKHYRDRYQGDVGQVLWIAHRRELLEQTNAQQEGWADSFYVGWEQAERWVAPGGTHQLVLATVQTISREPRLTKFDPQRVKLIVVDEAHHAPAATYRKILERFPEAKVLGATATPYRQDGTSLGEVFDSIGFEYSLRQAIEDGYLVPVRNRVVTLQEIELERVRAREGDFVAADLDKVMTKVKPVVAVAHILRKECKGSTLVFASSVGHSDALAGRLDLMEEGSAASLVGTTPQIQRDAWLESFRHGGIRFLVNFGVATEGFDLPEIQNIAMVRPTKSRGLYVQMLGRGLRPLPGVVDQHETPDERKRAIGISRKPCARVWDFVGVTKHEIVTATTLFSRGERRVQEVAQAVAASSEEPVDVAEIVAEAERKAYLAQAVTRAGYNIKKIRWKTEPKSIFRMFGVEPELDLTKILADPPSGQQAVRLKRAGVRLDGMSAAEAERLLETLTSRRKAGLMTYKQAKLLVSRGFPPDLTMDEATRIITDLRAHGWAWTRYKPAMFRNRYAKAQHGSA